MNNIIKLSKKIKSVFNNEKGEGFTLIEVLVASFLTLIVFLGIFTAYQLGLRVIAQSKNKITATAIVNGEIEQIRNLSYGVVGVMGGFPDGDLESSKTTTVGGIDFTVETRVNYVIDEADGISAPNDDCPNDYKKVEVKVFWAGFLSGDVTLVTDIAPDNLVQECVEEGGILLINVFDAFGTMVPSPLIEIRDPDTDQIIKTAIPNNGSYFFSLSPDSYKVIISKTEYSSSRTYGIGEVTSPEKPHLLVLNGQLTESSFSIDRLSSINIETVGSEELEYPVIPNVSFSLVGNKIIGTDINEAPVYKYSENHITDELGLLFISNMEWDVYSFIPDNLDLIEPVDPVSLNPNTNQDIRLILQADNSLLVVVRDAETSEPIFSAESRLYNAGFDIMQYTDEDGRTYYIPLDLGSYNLEVSVVGYAGYSGNFSVSGDVTKIISLDRNE